MIEAESVWLPGSFTKNFGWGPPTDGLLRLHEMINIGFEGVAENTPRGLFRERVSKLGRPDYIALQFFLYNTTVKSQDFVVADELVFQAINFPPGPEFDKLGMFAFCLSLVGHWKSAKLGQSRPAEWARYYLIERVAELYSWNTSKISATDIEAYVSNDKRYKAQGARKLSTNLNYLFGQGKLAQFNTRKVERWWVNCVFLALDRIINEKHARGQEVSESRLHEYLITSGLHQLSGPRSVEKDLASKHLVRLYWACGGPARLSPSEVRNLHELRLPNMVAYVSNDNSPVGAVSQLDPRIQKTIPRACALLAKELARFETMEIDELENLDVELFIRKRTIEALSRLKTKDISPSMTADQLFKITREK